MSPSSQQNQNPQFREMLQVFQPFGTWQQLILVDFDNHPRERRLVVTVSGVG